MSSFWPGYRGLVRYGRWSFLAIAILFAIALNAAVVSLGYWTSFGTPLQRWGMVLGVACWWIVLSLVATRLERRCIPVSSGDTDAIFRDVVAFYLGGSWFEAEVGLQRMLQRNSRDVEATLFYATLLRRTGRIPEAMAHLKRLKSMDEASAWQVEIAREEELTQ